MSTLTTRLAPSAQARLINKEVLSTLLRLELFIQIDVQTTRPSVDWSFMGQPFYVQDALDMVIDVETFNSVAKVRKAFDLKEQDTTILPIYKLDNSFTSIKNDNDGYELIGFASMGLVQSAQLGLLGSANHQHETELNKQHIREDIDELTNWKNKEIFCAYLTKADGDLVAHIKDIRNHHRDLEVAINRALVKNLIDHKPCIEA